MNETDTPAYWEFPAPSHLRHALACVWARRGSGQVRVVPDACTDIVRRPGEGAGITGPDTGPWRSHTKLGELIPGVRFLPGAGGPALGLPLSELGDRRIAIAALGLDPRQELGGDADPRAVARLLVAAAERLVSASPPDPAGSAIKDLLDQTQRVKALAVDLGFSERRFLAGPRNDLAQAASAAVYADQAHLTRECQRLTGLTPSQLP